MTTGSWLSGFIKQQVAQCGQWAVNSFETLLKQPQQGWVMVAWPLRPGFLLLPRSKCLDTRST